MNDGIDLSSLTGTLRTYSYFGPKGKDYIVEISTEGAAPAWPRGNFGWMSDFFFRDLFSDAVRSNPYVKEVDLYLVYARRHLVVAPCQARKLDPVLTGAWCRRSGREEVTGGDGRHPDRL